MRTRDHFITACFFIMIAGVLFACALSVQASPQLFLASSAFFWIATIHLWVATIHLIRANRQVRRGTEARTPPP